MQNHSGYTEEFANFTPDITINGTDSQSLSQYLSLIKESDKALEELVNYFSEQEEKTVIVFFGDHQPADFVVEPILQLQGRSGSSLTEAEQAQRYEVPFLIWANYDIEEAQKVEISANYLSGLVLEAAGVPLPVYQTYLEELRQTVPVLSAQWMVTAGGYVGLPDEQEDVLSQYRKMQYYLLFDSE